MNTQELKEYIGRVLGNSIRCLLPSYWWKRLFGLVIDKVDEVEGKVYKEIPELITSSLAEFAKKYPDVESRTFYVQGNQEKNLELLRKIGEEYGTGLIKQLYLAWYVNPDDEAFIIISPQFGVLNSDGYVFYDVAAPLSQIKKDVVIKQDGSVELKDAVYTCKIDTKLSENSTYPLANYATTSHLWRRVTMIQLSSTSDSRNKEVYERLNRGLNVPLVICADGYAFRQSSYYQVIATDDNGSTVRLWGSLYDASTDKPIHKYIIVDLDSEGITTIVEEGDIQSSSFPYDDTEIRNELNLVSERIDDLNSEKQDVINDLETIRSGAALGATALQEHQDISHLATKSEVNSKQDTLVSGTNIKTINGESILGEGNLTIQGGNGSYDDTEIRNELSKKADVDGVYPDMTVGMTRDMLGVGEGDESEFLFRPTDGDGSIKDGFASIERIEGNSVVWNQMALKWVDSYTAAGVTASWDGSKIHLQGVHNSEGDVNFYSLFRSLSLMVGHKYALILQGGQYTGFYLIGDFNTQYIYKEVILEANGDVSDITLRVDKYASIGQSIDEYVTMHVTDLTRMFGAGNEPTTIEEFYQRIPKGIDINAYNEGEVVNMNVEGIKSVGFNAWDEEWERGMFNDAGEEITTQLNDTIRCANPIEVLPNTDYYVAIPNVAGDTYMGFAFFYDNEGNFIIKKPISGSAYLIVKTPSNAHTMRFYIRMEYGTAYNNDICINLVHTGYRNGEYEPYVSDEIALPIADYFPNGMNSIGDVKDELTATEAIQRIGVVDMGTLGVAVNKANEYIFTTLPTNYKAPNSFSATFPAICALFNSVSVIEADTQALTDCIYGGNSWIIVRSSKHSDLASLKAAINGVMLYYELAEPIVTSIDKPLDLDYQVWDFGTEEAIAEGKTTPLKASIIYEFNARDTIRANKLALKNKADKTYVDNAITQAIISTINANY